MAVYTEVSDEDLTSFLAQYDLGDPVACKGIAEGIENSNFQLTTTTGTFILTLYEKRVDRGDLPFFLGLMEHLAGKGIPCPTPVPGTDGQALRDLCGRPAAIITFLPGMWPKRVMPEHCSELGRALAEMHVAGSDFRMTRANSLSVADWRPLIARADTDHAATSQAQGSGIDGIRPGLKDEVSQALDALEAQWPKDLPAGVIHADLFPDNVFFRGHGLSGLIDFYFACTDFLAYDIAVCLNAWCFEPDLSFNVTKARRLLKAYDKVRPVSDAELTALPILARGAAMRFLATRLYDWLNTPADAFVTRKDPLEYLAKLRFHARTSGPGDYGF